MTLHFGRTLNNYLPATAAQHFPPQTSAPIRSNCLHTLQIGPYTILSVLGVGGMGIVYKAEQLAPIRRLVVPLKVIKPYFNSKSVIARFQSERSALAMMDHPNIAKIYDAGVTDTGQPYFAMEFVSGLPIVDFADLHTLTIRQRLRLFLQACEAIAHAHVPIIHRDVKASNVLAYVQDGRAAVKVIDFGIAKALAGDSKAGQAMQTVIDGIVGTYEYMSPEQAAGSVDIDTRTDVYSLGVLLYELLTGARPFDPNVLRKAAEEEIRRMIQQVEPPKPSTRLSELGDKAAKVVEARRRK